jgi:hypothetical protein
MPTIWVRKIDGGLDARRLPETTAGGALIKAEDGHLNRGGEFEKRAAFVPEYTLPAGTVSLAADADGLYVFGEAAAPVGIPAGVTYQRLQNGVKVLDRVASWDLFSGDIFAVGLYTDDTYLDFYDGTSVSETGVFAQTIGTKEYIIGGASASTLEFSTVADPTDWGGTGSGFIDMSQYLSGAETLTSLIDYQGATAIFSERTVQIWTLAADPDDNARTQTLRNTGTASPRSVTAFGDGDVFYLDESGLRSLRARDSSNSASTSGIGVRVDPLIVAKLRSLTEEERAKIIGLVEPQDGRFWLIMKDTIYVFTYFPEEKISGWTTYTTHHFVDGEQVDFDVDDACVFNRRVYLRSGDTIFAYGGIETGLERDATEAEAWLPYLDGDNPAKPKAWRAFDAAVSGEWAVAAGMSLRDNDEEDDIGIIFRTSYNDERIGAIGMSTHLSLRFRSRGEGTAILSACALHYDDTGEDKSKK